MSLLFNDNVATSTTFYLELPRGPNGILYIDVQWKDATSSATITVESTSLKEESAPTKVAGSAWVWKTESGITVTGPAGSAAGSTKVHVSNFFAPRARLKVVTAAACLFEIHAEAS